MKLLIYTQELLSDLGACASAAQWATENITEGAPITRELLESLPHPLWVWCLACRLDTKHELIWLAPNVALREATKSHPPLGVLVSGKIGGGNWKEVRSVVANEAAWAVARGNQDVTLAAARAEKAIAAAGAVARKKAWEDWEDDEDEALRSASEAAEAAARVSDMPGAVEAELATAATQWLIDNGFVIT